MPSRILRRRLRTTRTLALVSVFTSARGQRFTEFRISPIETVNPSGLSPDIITTAAEATTTPSATALEKLQTPIDPPIASSSDGSTIITSPTPSPSSNHTSSSSPSLAAPAAAGIAIALTLLLVALLFLLGLYIHRRRRRQRKLNLTLDLSRRRSESDVDWNNMLKPVASPTGSTVKKKKPLPQQPHRLETNLPNSKQLFTPTPLSATASAPTFAPTPLSEMTSANPFDADVFEMPGSAVSGESPVVVMELEGCTPVEQGGKFVWPTERGRKAEVERSRSGRSTRSTRSGKGQGRSASTWSLLRKDGEEEPPAVPVKDAVSRSVALKR